MTESPKPGAEKHLESPILTEREKPALDEATFQQLLEAAHVLQEQKTFEVVSRPTPDPTEALAQIVETQEFLRTQPDDLQAAAAVVVERLQKITHATGVAVAVVRENRFEYCAATGDAASLTGTSLPMDTSLSADGQLSTQFSTEHPEKQSIALPLHHDGNLCGLLEVRFGGTDAVRSPEMRSCQLMAGLMTEAIARAADREWKETLAAERAAMLEALERIKPQLERLAVGSASNVVPKNKPTESMDRVTAPREIPARPRMPHSESSAKSGRETVCPQCGYQFGQHELFCGRCGTARPAALPSDDLENQWAPPWLLQPSTEDGRHGPGKTENSAGTEVVPPMIAPSSDFTDGFSRDSYDPVAQIPDMPSLDPQSASATTDETPPKKDLSLVLSQVDGLSSEDSETPTVDLPAILPEKSPSQIWLAKHRADLYVGAALLLLLVVLSGWGMRSDESHVAAKHPAQPSLTLFEKLLVSLGLAEMPPAPTYLGNPNAPVWVDLHTALYYCSGSDLYGKTPGGKFTTQRDAQLDQFEPAARKTCE
ncbi:MAG TPA: hypothetical protein VGP35_12910 [Terriglobales bacterium]|jgi:hypothetical protein|nr:hypothetical protein [Terriglobales bacterium]